MGAVLSYTEALTQAMGRLAADPRTLFVGQAVAFDGQAAYATFRDVPRERRIEMPVCEDFQMGFCTGLALQGYLPVSFYPRWDFLLMAANQLVNHLDKIPAMGAFRPKVIVRTAVGRAAPLDPGPQHVQDHTAAFRAMLRTVAVLEIRTERDIAPCYEHALRVAGPVLVIEHMDQY